MISNIDDFKFSFRVGTTSYILPDDILANVRFLADKVQDIELLFFEVDDDKNVLPPSATVRELQAIAGDYNLTYTVHLPLDSQLPGVQGERYSSTIKTARVINATSVLNPWAYILHLDGHQLPPDPAPDQLKRWQDECVYALRMIGQHTGEAGKIAVENTEHYPPEWLDPIFSGASFSRCVDIGHLWLAGLNPLPPLIRSLPRIRVVHIHGVVVRDHRSLDVMPEKNVEAVVHTLLENRFSGVLTLEIFNESDLRSSLAVLERIRRRLWDAD